MEKENVGVSTARDIAIKATSSEYVTMIDGNDFYYNVTALFRGGF